MNISDEIKSYIVREDVTMIRILMELIGKYNIGPGADGFSGRRKRGPVRCSGSVRFAGTPVCGLTQTRTQRMVMI